jgi:hypothetical protein
MIASLSIFHPGMFNHFFFEPEQLKQCMADVYIYEKLAKVATLTLPFIHIKKRIF